MNCTVKVGIVVPVYNVEKYLSECLDSIARQTYKNIVVVLVEDASTDDSLSICKKYCERDERFKLLINEKNEGLGSTRNNGIRYLINNNLCEYVCFIDSDDSVSSDYVSLLLKSVTDNGCRIGIARYARKKEFTDCGTVSVINGLDFYKNRSKYGGYPSNCSVAKIFTLDLFMNNAFSKGLHEDIGLIPLLIMSERAVALIDCEIYYYRVAPSSITNKKKSIKHIDRIKNFQKCVDFCLDRNNGCEKHFLCCMFLAINEQKIYLRKHKKVYNKTEFNSYVSELKKLEKELYNKYDKFWNINKSQKYFLLKYDGSVFSKIILKLCNCTERLGFLRENKK